MGRSRLPFAARLGTRTGGSIIPEASFWDRVKLAPIHPSYGISVPFAAERSSTPSSSNSSTCLTSTSGRAKHGFNPVCYS
ncbi:hypothetical protein XENOCAPTIV_014225 [Xenoophorus captivus]|uniref:Uncharacterized protein n=1 Tax=Xenoophorus captivus TaxID=1517983 RepID=A0ABV0QI85_9TELE